ncbi:MAG: TonB-dependent receptor [Betaproteobacteria bacterium]|nr:TonB-dependent receptor [Betaproteobacteria bacterium]
MQRPKTARLTQQLAAIGLISFTAASNTAVLAQTTPPPKTEKIEVTGSSIKRIEGESALPVTVITRAEIDRSGATNPMELLSILSTNNSAGNVNLGNVIGSSTFSAQTASLRGLGGGRTLVLVDGKRINGVAGEVQGVQGVNLAVIPVAAIERVEVLKDGASAIYGSDAIGGVVNFILRTDYRGAEATVYAGVPTRSGGGDQQQANGSFGWGDLVKDGYNIVFSAAYNNQKSLDQRDRDFSRTSFRPEIGLVGFSSNTFPGNVTTGGIGVIGFPNCEPSFVVGTTCRYDPSRTPGVMGIPKTETFNTFVSGRFQINNDWQGYATLLASKDENNYVIQPVPISSLFPFGPGATTDSTILIRPSSPFYPTAQAIAAGVNGQPLDVRWRAFEAGLRDTTDTNESNQLSVGLKGGWSGWDMDASYFHSRGKVKSKINGGFPDASLLLPILNSGRVNLFGPNTPAITAEIRATNFNGEVLNGESTSYGFGAKAGRELFALPGGRAAFAAGFDFREEKLDQRYAAQIRSGNISGFGGSFPDLSGSRDVKAVFAELNLPILKSLEASIAVRQDRYSDFGNSTNPKVSIRWQPTKDILARASYGKGFLAPSLYQLFIPQATTVSPAGTDDPVRCPVTQNVGLDCDTQFTIITGGNAALRPEKSEQATAGVVYEPSTQWSFSADYFKIRLNGAITNGIPYTTILGDLAQYGNLVTRGPADPAFPNLPGRIQSILGTYLNLGNIHIQGFDVEAHYKAPAKSWGRVRFDISGTYYTRYDAQQTDGSYLGAVSNNFGATVSGTTPRWRHYASLSWERGPWTATLANNHQSAYRDVGTDANDNFRTVSAMSLWDVQGTYSGWKNLTFTLGVKNLLDTNPPLTNQQTTFQAGYDPSYYDARARFVYGSVRLKF